MLASSFETHARHAQALEKQRSWRPLNADATQPRFEIIFWT
jgi:hypothetical protein